MNENRKSEYSRKTNETDISVSLELVTPQDSSVNTGVPFLDHMLLSFAKHGRMALNLTCNGDTNIDDHHSVEDIGICLGSAFASALGDKKGIYRFGEAFAPMDDALVLSALDLSGRAHFEYKGSELNGYIGPYSEELTREFFKAFAVNGGINLHIHVLSGSNRHHVHEAIFKSAGLALYRAVLIDPLVSDAILSTKGKL